ncbi:hypothetical protein PPERSA_10057 [Pseudocohnilembus persalinus]|uniref:Uncharacterized protein n=1 Tax=Pseudocohnilembus persalinus TaxID=266149 RepID=A0A0V0QJY6_PSEPJ|nr:hypothetical protein PPERSA_10057 [Pseudocohnilembus persalinus]|eukprot:KRX02440.1 hypothetical protein PPERSA_10057 [Pseudocohnilembus persalinus]
MSYIEKQLTSNGYSPRRNYGNETSPLKISSSSRNLLGDFTQLRTDIKRKYQGRNSPIRKSSYHQNTNIDLNFQKDAKNKITLQNQDQPSHLKNDDILSNHKKSSSNYYGQSQQKAESGLDLLSSKIKSSVKSQITSFQKPLFQPQQSPYKKDQNSIQKKSVQQKIKSISPEKRNKSNNYYPGQPNINSNSYIMNPSSNYKKQTNPIKINDSYKEVNYMGNNTYNNFNSINNNISEYKKKSSVSQNINQLLEDQRVKNCQQIHKNYKDQLKNRQADEIIPQYRIQEIQDVLVDVNDQDFIQLPREYIEDLIKLSSVIMFKVKSSSYYRRNL